MLFDFSSNAKKIQLNHRKQTTEIVRALNEKYASRITFSDKAWNLILLLQKVVDPTDKQLLNKNQFVHTIEVTQAAERDGNEEMMVCSLVHDLGKILLLTDENPENVVCENWVIEGEVGIGLDNCICNWNHDEFIYMKLKNLLPEHMSWLIRYHSIKLPDSYQFMSDYDRHFTEKYLLKFREYDRNTKKQKYKAIDVEKYKVLIEKWFPNVLEL